MHSLCTKIGIIGGGQLGKMMILEAKKMGFFVAILDPDPNCAAHSISDVHITADFYNQAAFMQLAEICDIITYEYEHISLEGLLKIEKFGKPVYPTPKSLGIIQDKLKQKQKLCKAGVNVPEFVEINCIKDVENAGKNFGYPLMLKTTKGGYDGKGTFTIKDAAQIPQAWTAMGSGEMGLMAERFVDFEMEISVLACRGINGEIAVYPVAENWHYNEILRETRVPAAIGDSSRDSAVAVAGHVMEIFDGVGMFCVEMFLHKDGSVSVNEIAPRPHNSGHYTIEGCITSQFEQHIRAITGLPFGDTSLIMPVAMQNLLGEEGHEGATFVQNAEEALKIPGVFLHIYGKTHTKPKRKMGHITALGKTIEEAADKAQQAKDAVKIISKEKEVIK
ncbi:MAG: 5-(carboxyamino)imidazole ribonucleotide synthase [Defluviitaleaceae bacterium]|nr:5-(carboxyamino)imidazole ribonucleotide synthase [Defluviitaleaceae bacterium]